MDHARSVEPRPGIFEAFNTEHDGSVSLSELVSHVIDSYLMTHLLGCAYDCICKYSCLSCFVGNVHHRDTEVGAYEVEGRSSQGGPGDRSDEPGSAFEADLRAQEGPLR